MRKRLSSNYLILYREIAAVFSQIHTRHINTPCGQTAVLCCTQSMVITILFNIIKHQISLMQWVSKSLLWDNRFYAFVKVVISVNFSNVSISRVFCVCVRWHSQISGLLGEWPQSHSYYKLRNWIQKPNFLRNFFFFNIKLCWSHIIISFTLKFRFPLLCLFLPSHPSPSNVPVGR